ncbi:MAG TPA: hypothetical protein VFA53_08715 [Xanthobacteraceae bacterium]|nr:hypothetical protein [Xanthobacteraceae bacterium]
MTLPWRHPRRRYFAAAVAVGMLIGLVLAIRILSPSDIVSRDQSRTVSYTIDIVANGNFILAADADGFPATKPPLVNYLSAPLVKLFGPAVWSFMLPSLTAFLALLVLIFFIARDAFARLPSHPASFGLTQSEWAALLAVGFYGLSPMALRLAFVARPDMILVLFLTLGFYAANRALALPLAKSGGWAAVFWLAACLAAWAKGPIAVIPVGYGFLAAQLFRGDWRLSDRLYPAIGIPLSLAAGLAWPVAVYAIDPDHLRHVLLGEELGGQFEGPWYSGIVSAWEVPFFVVSRFMPWSLLLIPAALAFPWRQWRRHPLGPSLLYLALLTIPFIVVVSRRGDRFAPYFPLVAVLCAWAAVYAWRGEALLRGSLAALPLAAAGLAIYFLWFSDQAKDLSGPYLLDFVRQARTITAGHPVVACKIDNRSLALQALLGINQHGRYPEQAPAGGTWAISYRPPPGSRTRLQSAPLPAAGGQRLQLSWVEGGNRLCR